MKAYIINLVSSVDRKIYVQKVLEPFKTIEMIFVEGINGKELSKEQQQEIFNGQQFFERYGKYPRQGEIGCTLSHQKCYKELAASNNNYSIIFEDDIIPYQDLENTLEILKPYIDIVKPTIILLSGGYWYYAKKKLTNNYQLAFVYDAYFTHAYLINKSAATLLINERPFWLADDWRYLNLRGVNIRGVLPHIVDQEWNGVFTSLVFDNTTTNKLIKTNMPVFRFIESYFGGFIKKILKLAKCYEKASKN
jgi:glycosyl transferase family 25